VALAGVEPFEAHVETDGYARGKLATWGKMTVER
jgi:hypothetical protein